MSGDTPTSTGRQLRQIRLARGKSLTVIAGLAGISASYLSRLESGDRALDRRSLIAALANALDVSPSEITGAALSQPGDRDDDVALGEVRRALLSITMGEPRGQIQPAEQLRARVVDLVAAQNDTDSDKAGRALPALIRDLHATLDAKRDEQALLRLVTLAHMQGTQSWLTMIGAPMDLSWQAAMLARNAAERLDEPVSLAVSTFGTALGLLSAGAFDLATQAINRVELPRTTAEEMQLDGMLSLAASLVAAASREEAQRSAALEHAADLAEHTGETNLLGFGFGPSNVGVWRMQAALESGDYTDAAEFAAQVNPEAIPVRARRAVYWREYGRALARLPRQRQTAVAMLRKAEQISPEHVHRNPFTRATLAELVARAKRDAVGRELRGMAYRAGLPV